jgi:hypothetical protein
MSWTLGYPRFPATAPEICLEGDASLVIKRCNMRLTPERKVREQELGGISKMTLNRWRKDGFPSPVVINNRNYFTEQQLRKDIPAYLAKKISE